MQTEERRKFTRIPFSSRAILTSSDARLSGTILNLSINGTFLKVPQKIDIGRAVEIELFLTGPASDLSVVLSGEVVRHVPDGVAIKFTGMYLDVFERLREVVASGLNDKKKVVEEFLEYMER
ncbi:MAG: PilZ domain-containing protein [Syntrophobacter sp.]